MAGKNKDTLKQQAASNNTHMEQTYPTEIKNSVDNSVVYGEIDRIPPLVQTGKTPMFAVAQQDTVDAIFQYAKNTKKMAVLNFADYKEPGGKYTEGFWGQEQALCHSSFLYSVLKEFPDYYKWNKQFLDNGMFRDRAIYTPDVHFFRKGEEAVCDIITCAAPNKEFVIRYKKVTEQENYNKLFSRIRFIHSIAAEQGVETLILGAWGCETFKQDPNEVAALFKDEFCKTPIRYVTFAIGPEKKPVNFAAFMAEISGTYITI